MKIKTYRDLIVWQKGTALAKEIHQLSQGFPGHERFGLAIQIRRAAISVPSNIAEGQSRRHTKEFRQFLYHSLGSLAEVDTQLFLAQEFGYVKGSEGVVAERLIGELRRMIHVLLSRLPLDRGSESSVAPRSAHRPLTTNH